MWEFIKANPFIVGALTGSLASYLLGLFVAYLKRERKVLGYSTVSLKVVENLHKDLNIHYKGEEIKTLYSHQISVRNIGNRALKELPVRIKFNSKFLDLELSQPEGANFTLTSENENEIVVNCDMLERNENFRVGFTSIELLDPATSTANLPPNISVIARAENLRCEDLDTSDYLIDPKDILAIVAYDTFKAAMNVLKSS